MIKIDYRDYSLLQRIEEHCELSNQVSDSVKEKIKDIPWAEMYGIRNILAHAYIQVIDETIWETAKNDIPKLKERLNEIL